MSEIKTCINYSCYNSIACECLNDKHTTPSNNTKVNNRFFILL